MGMIKHLSVINGSKISYLVNNPQIKPTVVALHGLRGNSDALIRFSERFKNHRVIMVDLPGHGKSEPLNIPHSVNNFALFLNSFVNELRLTNFFLWGHSYGALIALQYASMEPKQLRKLILVCPALFSHNMENSIASVYYQSTFLLPHWLRRLWIANPLVEFIVKSLLIKNVSEKRRQELIHDGQRELKYLSPSVIAQAFLSYRTTNWQDRARNIHIPTLIIAGQKDDVVPLTGIEKLHELIGGSDLAVVKKQGHLAPVEVPEYIAQLTQSFILKSHEN